MPDAARPFSQFFAFGNEPFCELRFANAPAAMYFVISVFPISMTSGVLPPASVASNLPRWSPHVWYCTSTVVPGCLAWKAWLAAATRSGQPVCASTWSQTVILLAAARPLPEVCTDAVEAATASIAARAAAAKRRTFIDDPPNTRWTACGGCDPFSVARDAANGRTIGLYHLATPRTLAHSARSCQDQ